jgi:long-chain fatty acid transport protein
LSTLAVLGLPAGIQAQGIYLPGGGAAHLSMGGASTAKPVDAIGANYWNPAAIGRLGRSEVAVGGAFLFPLTDLESTAIGGATGQTRSDSGVGLTSNLGIVIQPNESPFTFGMGLNMIGAGGVNYPGDLTNPILSGIGPLGNVQGPIYASMTMLQLTPSAAYKLTDRLIVGAGPVVDIALASFDPAYFSPPDDANGDGIGTFPSATHGRPYWGGGVRGGFVYSITECIDVGASYTSPQWYETWITHARNEVGVPRTLTLDVTLPAIYSMGVSFQATEKLLLSTDLRYLDYENSDLFGTAIVDGGLGWRGIFAAATGARYQVTDRIAMSAGYVYNDNPIREIGTLFNIQAPVITQHTVTAGSTFNVSEALAISLGYAYAFPNSLTGPVREAVGPGVSFDTQAHLLTFTMQFKFGATPCCQPAATECCAPANVSPTSGHPG